MRNIKGNLWGRRPMIPDRNLYLNKRGGEHKVIYIWINIKGIITKIGVLV